ncbi:hypothetical protein BpHYR1_049891 [Brachionus plicatilis]|uniref:Uncharacterized protein n=1 Tax=Brachionus plicatilis TaxID=10195 RepID=A0A3M7QG17_BRAPC|nr:hypothetical protein BpHYR1_049891 [Brachionus plicatilis]
MKKLRLSSKIVEIINNFLFLITEVPGDRIQLSAMEPSEANMVPKMTKCVFGTNFGHRLRYFDLFKYFYSSCFLSFFKLSNALSYASLNFEYLEFHIAKKKHEN